MPLLPRGLWERINRLRHGAAEDPFDSWCPMDRDYAEQMNVSARATAVGFDPLFRPPALSREWRAKVLTMAWGEGTDTMLAMEIIHGIPSRDPTSYRPLVEFCVGIPDDQYLRNGVRRWLAKRMLRAEEDRRLIGICVCRVNAKSWSKRSTGWWKIPQFPCVLTWAPSVKRWSIFQTKRPQTRRQLLALHSLSPEGWRPLASFAIWKAGTPSVEAALK